MTGAETARKILHQNGLAHVQVNRASGFLTDHYDPSKRIVRLSPDIYDKNSIAAVAVAAHETGHAIQHSKLYGPLKLRNMMVPLAKFGSNFAWIIIIGGFFLQAMGMVKVGIILFSTLVVFEIITLPVEFNASSRAKQLLTSYGMVNNREAAGVNKMLTAAAMTYVAAALSSVATLIYFLIRSGILGGDD